MDGMYSRSRPMTTINSEDASGYGTESPTMMLTNDLGLSVHKRIKYNDMIIYEVSSSDGLKFYVSSNEPEDYEYEASMSNAPSSLDINRIISNTGTCCCGTLVNHREGLCLIYKGNAHNLNSINHIDQGIYPIISLNDIHSNRRESIKQVINHYTRFGSEMLSESEQHIKYLYNNLPTYVNSLKAKISAISENIARHLREGNTQQASILCKERIQMISSLQSISPEVDIINSNITR